MMPFETLHHNEWLDLRKSRDGYVYSHEARCGGILVAVLPFRRSPESDGQDIAGYEFLMRFERNPAHDLREVYEEIPFKMCSITGGAEQGMPLPQTALHELVEEAGVVLSPGPESQSRSIDTTNLIRLGTCRPSKSADTSVALFSIDLAGVERVQATGDGSQGEVGAWCDWRSVDDLIGCKDPLAHTCLLRLLQVVWPRLEISLVKKKQNV